MARFCTRCGSRLNDGACPRCGAPRATDPMAAVHPTRSAQAAPESSAVGGAAVSPAGVSGYARSWAAWRRPMALPVALCVLGVVASGGAGPLASTLRLVPVLAALAVLVMSAFAPEALQRHLAPRPRVTRLQVEAAALLVLLVLGVPTTMTWGILLLVAGVVLFAQRRLRAGGLGELDWRPLWSGGWGRRTVTIGLALAVLFLIFAPWIGASRTRIGYEYGGLNMQNLIPGAEQSAFDAGYAQLVVPPLVVAVCTFTYRQRARPAPAWLPWAGAALAWTVGGYAAVASAMSAEAFGGPGGSYVQNAAAGPFLFCAALAPFVWVTWCARQVPPTRPAAGT